MNGVTQTRTKALGLLLLALLVTAAGCGGKAESKTSSSNADAGGGPLPPGGYLYLAGYRHLTIVDVKAGASWVARRPRVAPYAPFPLLRRGNRLVYDDPRGRVRSIDLNLLQRPRRLGVAEPGYFIPSARPDRVWLAVPDRNRPSSGSPAAGLRAKAVREVDALGRVTQPDARPPGGAWPDVAFRSEIALRDDFARSSRHAGLVLWSPRRGVVLSRLRSGFGPLAGGAGPANGNLIAQGRPFADRLRITNVATQTTRQIRLPHGFHVFDVLGGAEFSPDGRWLAAPVSTQTRRSTGRPPSLLALVDLESGRARLIPRSRVPHGVALTTWASDSGSVFLTGGGLNGSSQQRIVVYRVGARRARQLPAKVGPTFGMAAS